MATFTISTPTNIDAISGKAGADTYNVNGGVLTIDQDSRYGLNNTTSTIVGTVTPSATLGGSVNIDGRYVRLIPYNTGSGNVPAYNTTISKGGASGLLIGVYSALNVAPTAPGAAMPASGFIKIKQWNSVAFSSGALTGISASATGADVVGWIEVVGTEGPTSWTFSRLNNPTTPITQGDWYELGTTDGNRATTYQIPTNGVNQYHAGVWVETSAGSGQYEFYPATSDTMTSANIATSALKGKWCKIDATTGLVRFGHDGTNSSGGYCPPTGLKVRMPNVFMTSATSAAPTANSFNITPSQRPRFITSGAARMDLRNASFNWGFASITNPQYLNMQDMALLDSASITNPAQEVTMSNVGVGSMSAFTGTRLAFATVPFGIDADKVVVGVSGQGSTSNLYNFSLTDVVDAVFTDCKGWSTGVRGATTQYPFNLSRVSNVEIDGGVYSGQITASSVADLYAHDFTWFDCNPVNNFTAQAVYTFSAATQSTDWVIDNMTITNGDLPRNGLITVGSSSARITMRNVGTYNSPIGTGLYEEDGASWSRVTTTCTVTTASPHGLTTGDTINVYRTPATTTIARGTFTVTVTGANTFTFTCLNAGATSGVLSYFTTQPARGFLLANCDAIKFQNVHIRGIRTTLYGMDNTCTNIYLENVSAGWRDDGSIVPTASNLRMFGTMQTTISQAAGSSIYGTQIRSGFTTDDPSVPNGVGVSWTRTTTVATVTKTNHGLVTATRIMVTDSTNTAAFASGTISNIAVIDKDTFTVPVTNAGTTSGTLDYITADGAIFIDGNESSASLASLFTVVSGTPVFTGAGALAMFSVGDEVIWESERFIKDFDRGENMLPQMTGGTISNHELYYDVDTGSGYSGTWKNLSYPRTGGGGSSASTTVTMTDTTGVQVGDYVYGAGIATAAKVQSITNATDIVVTIANTGAVSGTLYFNQLPSFTSIPADGFKVKIRCKTITTNAAAITFLRIFMRSTNTTRANLYTQVDLPTQTVTVTNGVAGTRIQIYDNTAGEELYNGTPTFPFTWTDDEIYDNDREIRIRAAYVNGATAKEFIEAVAGTSTLTEPDVSYRLNQVDDEVYNDNAIDGSAITEVTIDDATFKVNIDAGEITWAEIYAYECYWLFTSVGIQDIGKTITAVDTANYRVDSAMFIKNITSPSVPLVLTGGWGVDATTGSSIDLVDTTGGTIFNAPDHVVAFVPSVSVTPTDLENIADAVWDEQLSGHQTGGSTGKAAKDASKAKLLL